MSYRKIYFESFMGEIRGQRGILDTEIIRCGVRARNINTKRYKY